jgi:hypothetical protein
LKYKGSFDYMNNYLNERFENYCSEILSEDLKTGTASGENFFNISFSTLLDKLIFVLLYEFDKYDQVLEEVYSKIYNKLDRLEEDEIDFLYAKCVDGIYDIDYSDHNNIESNHTSNGKYRQIADEFIKIINQNILDHLSNHSQPLLKSFIKKLQGDIENFAYGGPPASDYNINNYWEEFCFHIQYGEGYLLDVVIEDIERHLYSKIENASIQDIILLYTTTDEFNYEDNHIENNPPLPPRIDMINEVVPKLLEEIKYVASTTPTPDFSTGEDWEDE